MTNVKNFLNSLAKMPLAEAIAELEAALGRYPNHQATLYQHLGKLRNESGLIEPAIQAFNQALEHAPNDIYCLAQLAKIYAQNNQVTKAAEYYQHIIDTQTSPHYWAYVELGNQHERLGNLEKVSQNFRLALTLDPSVAELRHRFFAVQHRLNQEAAALDFFAQQLEKITDPEVKLNLLIDLTEFALQIKSLQLARDYYQQAFELPTEDSNLKQRLANLEHQINPPKSAIQTVAPKLQVPAQPAVNVATAKSEYPRLRGYLCLRTKNQTWYFVRHKQWFTLADQSSLCFLLAAFPVKVLDHRNLRTTFTEEGRLQISQQKNNYAVAEFIKDNNQVLIIEAIIIDDSSLFSIEWLHGNYSDGWLKLNAELKIEGATQIEFGFYVPKQGETNISKTIKIIHDQQFIHEQTIKRGVLNQTPVLQLFNHHMINQLQIIIDSPEAKTRDKRELGVMCSQCRVNGIDYQPF